MEKNIAPVLISFSHSQTLNAWVDLAASIFPGVHENRKREWALGREALRLSFAKVGIDFPIAPHELIGYQSLLRFPEWIFSLSHSKEWGGALLLPKNNLVGVGLDLELNSRQITADISNRMSHEQDECEGLTLWSAKEAAYKTLPPEVQEKIWLNQICIKKTHFKVESFAIEGEWNLVSHPELCVVSALGLPPRPISQSFIPFLGMGQDFQLK